MATKSQIAEQRRERFKQWYANNKEAYSAKRKARYASDPEVREKARLRSLRYREERPTVERQLIRVVNGRNVKVFSTGQIADEINCTQQTLRNWGKLGLIPDPIFEDTHLLYTAKQKRLIVKLAEVIAANKGSLVCPEVKKFASSMARRWV